jgi:hypothetical protein
MSFRRSSGAGRAEQPDARALRRRGPDRAVSPQGLDGALSIVDLQTIGSIDLVTGGFTTDYGDRLAGVLTMETQEFRESQALTTLGLSVTNVRATNQGEFADGDGQWMVAARRGYLDLAVKLGGGEIDASPTYYDFSGKVEYRLNPQQTLSLHVLYAGIPSSACTKNDDPDLRSSYDSAYLWGRWRGNFGERLSGEGVLSFSQLDWHRDGNGLIDWRHPPVPAARRPPARHRGPAPGLDAQPDRARAHPHGLRIQIRRGALRLRPAARPVVVEQRQPVHDDADGELHAAARRRLRRGLLRAASAAVDAAHHRAGRALRAPLHTATRAGVRGSTPRSPWDPAPRPRRLGHLRTGAGAAGALRGGPGDGIFSVGAGRTAGAGRVAQTGVRRGCSASRLRAVEFAPASALGKHDRALQCFSRGPL